MPSILELSLRNVPTDADRNPILQVVTWMLLGTTSLALLFRFISRFLLRSGQYFGWEEVLITTSYVIILSSPTNFLC